MKSVTILVNQSMPSSHLAVVSFSSLFFFLHFILFYSIEYICATNFEIALQAGDRGKTAVRNKDGDEKDNFETRSRNKRKQKQ